MITTPPPDWRETTVRRVLRLLDRPARSGLGVITAYRDGTVTLRSNRREDGYTFSDTENGYQEIRPGDLVFHALDGFAGAVGVSDSHGNGSPVYHVCEPVAGDDPAYLARLLRHLGTSGFLATQAPNVRERSVDFRNWSTFARIPLVLPPADDQRFIADYLDRETAQIDTLIEEQQRLIEMLRERRGAVISNAVARGLVETVALKDSGLPGAGPVPAHWEVMPLRYTIWFQEGPGIMAADFREHGVPLLRVSSVRTARSTLEGCNYLDPDEVDRRWSHFRVDLGDLLISASASMGTVSEVTEETTGSVPYTGIIRIKPGGMHRDFIRWFVVSGEFIDQVDTLKTGSTIQHFGPTHLAQMRVALPPIDEQRQIAAHLDEQVAKIDRLIAETERFIEIARERRSALITAAVTGQIDVRGVA
ncbi:restriction endonuclease subunit S [Streptomyces sp. 1331.2]|uniref:restriction endonuclease subunit S n=1 Tax=Streptomyces sp. 1331.2 TaxID=1938835 RepID=UPI000BCDBDB8|nr:restriction endonuclease subunit S [Streptomyces sp. 1331.2]SOB83242.1 type I restriction enzyme, S subunit [Streptomyces sp. 1331.2]